MRCQQLETISIYAIVDYNYCVFSEQLQMQQIIAAMQWLLSCTFRERWIEWIQTRGRGKFEFEKEKYVWP